MIIYKGVKITNLTLNRYHLAMPQAAVVILAENIEHVFIIIDSWIKAGIYEH